MSLVDVQRILGSSAHRTETPTRDYGPCDPLAVVEESIFPCPCGIRPRMVHDSPPEAVRTLSRTVKLTAEGKAWFILCPHCGRAGPASLRDWRAMLDWNFQQAEGRHGSLEHVPFFGLAGTPANEAAARLRAISWDLALRIREARLRKEAGHDISGRYLVRLEAYRGWAQVALQVLKTGPREALAERT